MYVGKGHRGHCHTGVAGVHTAGRRKKNTTGTERQRRRSVSEPKAGHLKSDHRIGRCFLARPSGDAINAIPAAAAFDLRKLLGVLRRVAGWD